jgi:hypothetical protein
MRVYRFTSDVNQYQYFLPDAEEDVLSLLTECQPMLDAWHPPAVFVFKPLHKPGDLYGFYGCTPIFSPRATEALAEYLAVAGELLPLPYKGEVFTALNVLECVNSLDEEHTEWAMQDGVRLYPKKYVFRANHFSESHIFKIPETYRAEVLVADWEDGEGFVDALVEHKIVGYELGLLWSSR